MTEFKAQLHELLRSVNGTDSKYVYYRTLRSLIRKRVDSFDSRRSFCIHIMSNDLLSEGPDTPSSIPFFKFPSLRYVI